MITISDTMGKKLIRALRLIENFYTRKRMFSYAKFGLEKKLNANVINKISKQQKKVLIYFGKDIIVWTM